MRRAMAIGTMAAGLAAQLGCAATIGGATADMNRQYIMPGILGGGDVLVGCAAGEALGAMVGGFADASDKAKQATVLAQASSAICMEDDVREAQLARARAYHGNRFNDARDAEAVEDRAHVVAAKRYLASWNALVETWGVPEPGEPCPRLKSEHEQLSYMMGLSAGVLAVLHDLGADNAVGVPQSIPAAVNRAAACLDDDTWWGVPTAMQASLWALQPGAEGVGDVWAAFEASVSKGEAAGVRLSTAYMVQTAATVGEHDRMRAAIQRDAAHRAAARPVDGAARWSMLDAYALSIVMHESDRLWTQAEGSRTPLASYGTFPAGEPDTNEPNPFEDLLK